MNSVTTTDISSQEAFLHSLFEYHPDALFLLRVDGGISRVNFVMAELLGYSCQELLEVSVTSIVCPHPKLILPLELSHFSQSKHLRINLLFNHKDGSTIHTETTCIPIIQEQTLQQVCCFARVTYETPLHRPDILLDTEADPSEAMSSLIQTKQLFESFITHTKDVISLAPLDGNLFQISQSIQSLFGWSVEEFIANRQLIVPNEEIYQHSWKHYEQVIKTGKAVEFETKRIHKDGTILDVSLTYSPIHDQDGTIIGTAGILRDITQQKRTDARLREIETKYNLITENASDLIEIIDPKGNLIYKSPSHEVILGYPLQYLEGGNIYDFVHPDDLKKTLSTVHGITMNKPSMMLEVRVRHMNGEWKLIEASGMPVIDESGSVQHIVVVARDITERKRTEELLRNSEKLSVIGELAAGIAHEIRNPLTSLRGFIQLMQEQTNFPNEHLQIMHDELDRINLIVSELLILAKPQAIHFKKNSIRLLLHSVLMLLDTQAIMNNVLIHLDLPEELPEVTCEANHVKQVFINIIKNAIEAMPIGGTIHILVRRVQHNFVLVQIKDQGEGISSDRLTKLGMPFYSTKEKGTGLGLMISKKIIDDHNGSFTITSALQKGTTVEILLPVEPF